jgi:hypothetical protein
MALGQILPPAFPAFVPGLCVHLAISGPFITAAVFHRSDTFQPKAKAPRNQASDRSASKTRLVPLNPPQVSSC